MSEPDDRVGAVVLAGGRSSRFGRDKLEVVVGDRRLLDLAIDAVRPIAQQIVVVGPVDIERVTSSDIRVVRDAVAFQGPLVGLATGLDALGPDIDRVVVVGGDMPALVPDVLRLLVDALDEGSAAWLERVPFPRPLPMAVRRSSASDSARALVAGGERRLGTLPESLGAVVVAAALWRQHDPDGVTLHDVDVPADLPDTGPSSR